MALVKTIDDLRAAVVARLKSLPVFPAKVGIFAEDRNNLLFEVNKALRQAGGLVIIMYTTDAVNTSPNSPIPQCRVDVVVEVGELVATNRGATGTKIPAVEAARICVRALHGWAWATGRSLVFNKQSYNRDDKSSVVQYYLDFSTIISMDADIGV